MRKKALLIFMIIAAIVGSTIFVLYEFNKQNNATQSGSSQFGEVLISEIMASNSGAIPDEDGNFFDWVELHNVGENAVDLTGWALSDREDEPRWFFPSGTILPADGYILIYCPGKNAPKGLSSLYSNFGLKAGEEKVVLSTGNNQVVDQIDLPIVGEDASWGRNPENLREWIEFADPTPGFVNTAEGRAEYEKTIVIEESSAQISELQGNNRTTIFAKDGDRPDWIELYNEGAQTVDLSGYGLSDDESKPMKWRFPDGTNIQPNQYLIVFASGDESSSSSDELHCNFKVSSFEGSLRLSNKRGQLIDSVSYDEIPVDASYARMSDGSWKVMMQGTPGFSNDDAGIESTIESANYGNGDLYISEGMLYNTKYAPDDAGNIANPETADWLEIHNRSANPIDLSGYGLSNNSANPGKWRFPDGIVIEPGEYLLLYATGKLEKEIMQIEAGRELAENAALKKKSLQLNYKLSNADGDVITLWDKDNNLLDKIGFSQQHRQVSYGRDENHRLVYFTDPSPGEANAFGYSAYAQTPLIELSAGFYNGTQQVSIKTEEGTTVYYSLDGSFPSDSSDSSLVYNEPINIDKTSVLRACAYSNREDVLPSETATSTFIIDNPHSNALSIVSLSANPDDFFDHKDGIYVKGPDASDVFPYKGANFWIRDWEKAAHVEIFNPQGQLEISQDIATRIFGSYSRGYDQKGLALIARSTYGPAQFDYSVFENRPFESYKSLVLRAGAQDSTVTKLHDIVATSLVDGTTNLEVQAYRQAVLYLNGEYFGIYNIREKVTRFWVAQHYNLKDPDNIDMMVGDGKVLVGDNEAYKELTDFCENNDLSDPANYEKVKTMMDVDNYIDFLIAEMYVANTDTGNIKWFRERTDDPERSKFRWIYYDFCWSFLSREMDSMKYWTNPEGHGVGKGFSTLLPRSLFKNQDFRNQFLRRAAELLNSIYTPENVLAKIAECEGAILDELPRDTTRWPWYLDDDRLEHKTPEQSLSSWNSNVAHMKRFAEERPGYFIYSMQKYFELSNSEVERIFGRSATPFSSQ